MDGSFPVGLIYANGVLCGTTGSGGGRGRAFCHGCGTVLDVNVSSGVERVLYRFRGGKDGAYPGAGVIDINGMRYGTTESGGGGPWCPPNEGNRCGIAFAVRPTTGQETVLYRFGKHSGDGYDSQASLINIGGVLSARRRSAVESTRMG
jgi:hypothetical protein